MTALQAGGLGIVIMSSAIMGGLVAHYGDRSPPNSAWMACLFGIAVGLAGMMFGAK